MYRIDDDHPVLNNNLPGYFGSSYEFKAGVPITSAEVSFDINPTLLTPDSKPVLLYFNEDKWEFEVVKQQRMEGNKLIATLEHFSPYTIVDAKKKFDFDGVNDATKQKEIKNEYDIYLKGLSKELALKKQVSNELSDGELSIFANLAYKNRFDELKEEFKKEYKNLESRTKKIKNLEIAMNRSELNQVNHSPTAELKSPTAEFNGESNKLREDIDKIASKFPEFKNKLYKPVDENDFANFNSNEELIDLLQLFKLDKL